MSKSIAEEAEEIINGERAQTYGNAESSFRQIADYWETYLNRDSNLPYRVSLSSMDVANMMILMKVSRAQNGFHRDSYVDICGYATLTEKLV